MQPVPSVEAENTLRAERSPGQRLGGGAAGAGAILMLIGSLVVLLMGLPVVAVLALVVALVGAAGAGYLLFLAPPHRVCASCGEPFGAARFTLVCDADELRYVLSVLDSRQFSRLVDVIADGPVPPSRVEILVTYCARCLGVVELAVGQATSAGRIVVRAPLAFKDPKIGELVAIGSPEAAEVVLTLPPRSRFASWPRPQLSATAPVPVPGSTDASASGQAVDVPPFPPTDTGTGSATTEAAAATSDPDAATQALSAVEPDDVAELTRQLGFGD